MRACKNCSDRSIECRVGRGSERCLECVRLGRKCDLSISDAEWERVRKERARLSAELQETYAKAARLQKQQELVESRWEEMVRREFQNIEELEEDERRQAAESSIDNLLLNVGSEQLEVPPDFDWLSGSFAGTVAEATDSS